MGETNPTTGMIEEARRCAALGWRVLPLNTGQKTPLIAKWPTKATTDLSEIDGWWSSWPDANIGMATGAASGVVVIDIDERHDGEDSFGELVARLGVLPETVESLTGGGGRQLFFRCPEGVEIRNATKLAGYSGVDVRGDGGYVVLPPSLHPSGNRYAWEIDHDPTTGYPLADLSDAWIELLAKRAPLHEETSRASGNGGKIVEGERNDRLFRLGCSMRRHGADETVIHAALIAENDRRCAPPLGRDEVTKIARSCINYQPSVFERVAPKAQALSPWPSDLDEAAYHGLAGDIVRAIEPHTEADPAALLIQVLTAFGNSVGRHARFMADGAAHFPNLFAVLIGATSKGRKGTSWAHILRLFENNDRTWATTRIGAGLSSGEGLIWAVRDPIFKKQPVKSKGGYEDVMVDEGVEDKRLLVQESEYATVLKVLARDGNTLSPIIRNAWDRGDLQSMTKNSPARATGAHISIVGHITRDELRRYLSTTETGNGFGNRFLWFCVRRSKILPDGGQIDSVDFATILRELTEAKAFASVDRELKRDDEARRIWHSVYEPLSEGKPGLVGALTARAEAQVMRLAMIYALLDRSECIRAEHLMAALAIWTYAEQSVGHVFGNCLGDPVADAIFAALRDRPDGMTRTEIRDLLYRHHKSDRITLALSLLQETGLARFERTSTGGRPVERWFAANPQPTNAI